MKITIYDPELNSTRHYDLHTVSLSSSEFGRHETKYWLANESGEGMSFSEKQLFDLFDKFFKDNL